MAWTNLTFAYGSLLTSTKMTQMDDNFDALVAGASGAPRIVQAALDAVVGQGQLKSTTGTLSRVTAAGYGIETLPGGAYGFYPMVRSDGGGNSMYVGYDGVAGGYVMRTSSGSNVAQIGFAQETSGTAYVEQRYIQASPPYNLGDGDIPLFVFCLMNSLGVLESAYAAPEAPWHHNGPTCIRSDRYDPVSRRGYRRVRQIFAEHGSIAAALLAGLTRAQIIDRIHTDPAVDVEITQAIKQMDMPLIPHPFQGNNLAGKTIIMLDPVSPLMQRALQIQESGDNLLEVVHSWLNIGNTALNRVTPPGVIAVSATLR